jgi:para-aminobenzoate synthetase component 1
VATVSLAPIRYDLDIPAERLSERIGAWREPAILESGRGFGDAGRWSVFTAQPRIVFDATGSDWVVRNDRRKREAGQGGALETLARLLDECGLARSTDVPDPDAPPFQGGMIGFFGYDLAPALERLPRKAPRDSTLPDIRFALYDTAVIVDHRNGRVQLHAFDILDEGRDALDRRARQWANALRRSRPTPIVSAVLGPVSWNFTRREYLAAAQRCLDYIAAGDVFQINLSRRFSAPLQADPLALYLKLRAVSPAPFGAFLASSDFAVVSASPELFYQRSGDRIVTRPIKGTRGRGETANVDALLVRELAASPKDRAELTMIVDLERNDLGRVCQYGSVRVIDPLTVESFAQVHHLVATVEGKIRPGIGPVDIVRALFPGGSITGAPKIRAMEIIDELEPTRRSLYTGAIGYFSRGGTSAFNIAIRTMIVERNRVSYQVGGGIVADSNPEAEYDETVAKGRGLRAVLESFAKRDEWP